MKSMDTNTNAGLLESTCRGLYKAGAVAALTAALLFRRNLDAEWMLLRMTGMVAAGPSAPPDTIRGWFTLLQQEPLLGLTFLNVFDLVNYALVGLIFLALAVALRRTNPAGMLVAAALSLVGTSVYFASNQALSMLWLSQQYAAASSESQQALILAAGQAALAIHHNASYGWPGIYLSFLFVSVAGLTISLSMLRSNLFSRRTAWMGILANGFQLGYYLVLVLAPALVFIPISISAVFLLAWYLLVGVRLWSQAGIQPALGAAVPLR